MGLSRLKPFRLGHFRSKSKSPDGRRDNAELDVTSPAPSASSSSNPSLPIHLTKPTSSQPSDNALPSSLDAAERLWNRAYEELKQADPNLVAAYEGILSRELDGQKQGTGLRNLIDQADTGKRRSQMDRLIKIGLAKTEKEAKIKQNVGEVMQYVLSLKEIVSSAIGTMPQAAIAWCGVCLALQILVNPISQSKANREGIQHVIDRMSWYNSLSYVIFNGDQDNDSSFVDLQFQMEKKVVRLYQQLLAYLLKSVCSHYRDRIFSFLRDTLKLDDWDGDIASIKDAETAFQKDDSTYKNEKKTAYLRELANTAKSSEDQNCIRQLRGSDPRDDKRRIEQAKGGLLTDSYLWILDNDDFRQWKQNQQSSLLWIKGDPGKGKTMLLCGIIDELKKQHPSECLLSYFFCQATDSRINSATAVLRGLLFLLIDQQPSLVSHVRKRSDKADKSLFEDSNAWFALSDIFKEVAQDPSLEKVFLVVDALDECLIGLPELLKLIVETSSTRPNVKWLISSRNLPSIEEGLGTAVKTPLSLELNAKSVSLAVKKYIEYQVDQLVSTKKYDDTTQSTVQQYLTDKADGTFLWVALVCQKLSKTSKWNTLGTLKTFPPGLESLYRRMLGMIDESDDRNLLKQILALTTTVYRPITLSELTSLINLPEGIAGNHIWLVDLIKDCGSFLYLGGDTTISLVHQSVKDFVLGDAYDTIFPTGARTMHRQVYSRSLDLLLKTLRRDIYLLRYPGVSMEQVQRPVPDPLTQIRYASVYWIEHLTKWSPVRSESTELDLCDGGLVDHFLNTKYLYWLEVLSLLREISSGIYSITKLEGILQGQAGASQLVELIRDARRFILYHRQVIEDWPLQVYASALLFSPRKSLIREAFEAEKPTWISAKTAPSSNWSANLQTLEGHSDGVLSVAFSPDSKLVASGSRDKTIRLWDTVTGIQQQTLEGHSDGVNSVAFSPNGQQLASGSNDKTIKLWDVKTGILLQTLNGYSRDVTSVIFSPNGQQLAFGSHDNTIKLWDVTTGVLLQTLNGHSSGVESVAFSPNGQQLASGSHDDTIKLWDVTTGILLQTLNGHFSGVKSVAFSPNGQQLASGSFDRTIKLWDITTGILRQTLNGHSKWVGSIVFSANGKQLASGSYDKTIKLWDPVTGDLQQSFEGHIGGVQSIALSPDGRQLLSGSDDETLKLWDTAAGSLQQSFEGHSQPIKSVEFSHDNTQMVSSSSDNTIKLWNVATGKLQQTFEGYVYFVSLVAFSPDGQRIVHSSGAETVKIWDVATGNLQQCFGDHSSVQFLAISHDSRQLASASCLNRKMNIQIWDLTAASLQRTIESDGDYCVSIAFSPDGRQLASACLLGSKINIQVWDLIAASLQRTIESGEGNVNSIAFSPNGRQLASASRLGGKTNIQLWDLMTGTLRWTLEDLPNEVNSISFLPDDTQLKTNVGLINLKGDENNVPALYPSHRFSISDKDDWILQHTERVLWFPPDYRVSHMAIVEDTMVLCHNSGQITFWDIDSPVLDQLLLQADGECMESRAVKGVQNDG